MDATYSLSLKEILTEPEAADYLGYKRSTIRKIRNQIPHYLSRNGRPYYKRKELEAWMLDTKIN